VLNDVEPNRAAAALDAAATSTAAWLALAADKTTRVFRSVDLDGDGIPDEPQALTAMKSAGSAIVGAGSSATRAFRRVDRDGDGIADEPAALSALRGLSTAARNRRTQSTNDSTEASVDSTSDSDVTPPS
jgi:hypothetical protein